VKVSATTGRRSTTTTFELAESDDEQRQEPTNSTAVVFVYISKNGKGQTHPPAVSRVCFGLVWLQPRLHQRTSPPSALAFMFRRALSRADVLTLLHKVGQTVPSTRNADFWEARLARAHQDLSAATERPVNVVGTRMLVAICRMLTHSSCWSGGQRTRCRVARRSVVLADVVVSPAIPSSSRNQGSTGGRAGRQCTTLRCRHSHYLLEPAHNVALFPAQNSAAHTFHSRLLRHVAT